MSRLCGAYADHVDHVVARHRWAGRRNGSTSSWRRLRLLVLDRDGWRCQLPVDAAGDYAAADDELAQQLDPAQLAGPDDPRNLRAGCARHNLQRGDGSSRPPAVSTGRRTAGPNRWEW